MKLLKKLLWLGAALTVSLGFGLAASSCDGDSSADGESVSASDSSEAPSTDNLDYVYRVSVRNATGFGFSGVTVTLKDGDTEIASTTTNRSGNANFLEGDVALGEYSIDVDLPRGYELSSDALTTLAKGSTHYPVEITPTGVIKEEAPLNTRYKLGDVMYDFTIYLSDGKKYTLSEVLETKEMVFLNFWATWCTPCKSEFPALHNATSLTKYNQSVSVLAVSTTDNKTAVASFKDSQGYTNFNMATSGANLTNMFNVSGIPHSIIIDRYGVVSFNHVGSMPSVGEFTSRFDQFIGEDYLPTVIGTTADDGGDSEDTPVEQIKPDVAAPAISDLKNAFVSSDGTANGFAFRYQEEEGLKEGDEGYDAYNWPWVIKAENGEKYLEASNASIHGSYSILYSTVAVKGGDVLTFDYKVGTEENYDILYVMLNNAVIAKYSGDLKNSWNTAYAYVFEEHEAGNQEIAFVYLKDSSDDDPTNGNVVQIKNLRIGSVNDLASKSDDINIFRNAATDYNGATDATTRYRNYATVSLWSDGYYHVSTGEYLYANLMNSSLWSNNSVWQLADNDCIIVDGINLKSALEDYCWEATQITTVTGYTLVTEDLMHLLKATVKNTSPTALYTSQEEADKRNAWSGVHHDDEWLELCVFWEHYGTASLPSDPMAGITFSSAIEMQEGDNHVSVPYAMSPRGFKYKFIPERSGAYRVKSTGTSDTFAFLMDNDRETMLGYWDNKVFESTIKDENGTDMTDGNFEFHWYFEAGRTYYLLFTTYMDVSAEYNVNIEWLGESYTYLENAAIGPYSANLITFELFLPDAIEYEYADTAETYIYANDPTKTPAKGDGYYHQKNEDGSLGGIIYLDLNRPTAYFTEAVSIHDICESAKDVAETKRAFYIPEYGEDYTDELNALWFDSTDKLGTDVTYGFAPVNKDVYELINKIVLSSKYGGGIDSTWLLLCYYERTVSADND